MTTDYVKQLEEENFSLKNLLDERTKELDEAKKEIESWRLGAKCNRLSPGISVIEKNEEPYAISSTTINDGQMFTAEDIANLKHLWALHMISENYQPLHYRIWRKIVSCLTTKKN